MTPREAVNLAFSIEKRRLQRIGEPCKYARAAASVKAAERALELGVVIRNPNQVIQDAGLVAEYDCNGTDDEAFAACEATEELWREKLSAVAR